MIPAIPAGFSILGAWQLVFVLGMLASNTGFATNLTKRQRWVIGGIALFLMLAFAIYRFCPLPREALGNRWEECLAWIYPSRNFFSKTINGPLRLLNASAVIIIVFCWIPAVRVGRCKREGDTPGAGFERPAFLGGVRGKPGLSLSRALVDSGNWQERDNRSVVRNQQRPGALRYRLDDPSNAAIPA